MGRVLVVATAGAGGDLQPLMAAGSALRDRGHELIVLGDRSVERSLAGLKMKTEVLPPELDLGPALGGAIRDAMAAADGDLVTAGPIVQERMATWADDVSGPVARAVETHRPDALVTSLFGVEALHKAEPPCPWVVVNSTFYVGPDPPRPVALDFGPRALPLIERYASLLASPDLVLHATDPAFDLSLEGLPERHHYVGPLGIWEPPSGRPSYLDEAGDPWVLVSISSQMQDDLPIAEAALDAMEDRPVRVLLTLGPDHTAAELSNVPPNARVEEVISHSAVLEYATLLVSHAGHGSVMKALWYGCPMVLIPGGRDQPGVATRAAALGVAEIVPREGASAAAIGEAVARVLEDTGMRQKAAWHAARLRSTDPPGVAAALIEGLL
ncbi:MAG TPA: nucleotide disphospho-sugar-binding domain-containing protein [Actinomycetota bacterium]